MFFRSYIFIVTLLLFSPISASALVTFSDVVVQNQDTLVAHKETKIYGVVENKSNEDTSATIQVLYGPQDNPDLRYQFGEIQNIKILGSILKQDGFYVSGVFEYVGEYSIEIVIIDKDGNKTQEGRTTYVDTDSDGDGLLDRADLDDDNDGIPDSWELDHGLDPIDGSDSSGDSDGDGISNKDEYEYGTDPGNSDSDNDGIPDGWEIDHGMDPGDKSDGAEDSDGDGISNKDEYVSGGDPHDSDSDGDSIPDSWEAEHGSSLARDDSGIDMDDDGLTLLEEFLLATDPQEADSDKDGLPDGWEVAAKLNPLDASDAREDPDNDGLTTKEEYLAKLDPFGAKTKLIFTDSSVFFFKKHKEPITKISILFFVIGLGWRLLLQKVKSNDLFSL